MKEIPVRFSARWRLVFIFIALATLATVLGFIHRGNWNETRVLAVVLGTATAAMLYYINRPRFVIGEQGIRILDWQLSIFPVFIAWSEIKSVELRSSPRKNELLALDLYDSGRVRQRVSLLARFTLLTRRLLRTPEFMIPVRGMELEAREIQSIISQRIPEA